MIPSRLSSISAADGSPMPSQWPRQAPPEGLSFLRSPNSPAMRIQQEVAWDPAQVYVDLQQACQILTDRGWKLAAKWAAEQWMGLPAVEASAVAARRPSSTSLDVSDTSSSSSPILAYAKTLMDMGEYAHAAAVLSQPHATVERMPPPLPDLNAAATSLRAYALYMAGERRKEESHQENSR
jgi:hypothetical protein